MLENCRRFFEKLLKSPWIWLKLVCINSALHSSLGVWWSSLCCAVLYKTKLLYPTVVEHWIYDPANDNNGPFQLYWFKLDGTCVDREEGTGSPDPPTLKYHKNIEFLSHSGLDPLKNHKATKPAFIVGHYRPASKTPLKWRFADRPIIARFWWFLEPRSPQKLKKNLSELDPLWQNFLDLRMWKNL